MSYYLSSLEFVSKVEVQKWFNDEVKPAIHKALSYGCDCELLPFHEDGLAFLKNLGLVCRLEYDCRVPRIFVSLWNVRHKDG